MDAMGQSRPRDSPAILVATGGTIAVLTTVALLHLLKPELDPASRFISEYAIGQFGWVMKLSFVAWAASCLALSVAVRPAVTNRRGRAGAWLLAVVGIALILAGIFPQDPVTITPDQATTSGMMHAFASMVGIPGVPIAALLILAGLPAARRYRMRIATHATWICLALMIAYLAYAVPRAGGFNPTVLAGWMNRLVVASYLAWQLLLARSLSRVTQ